LLVDPLKVTFAFDLSSVFLLELIFLVASTVQDSRKNKIRNKEKILIQLITSAYRA